MRRIFSTFLSNKVKSKNQLHENSFLIPSASKNLFIPCSVDLIINISNGYSQGIKKCEKTKQITYLYSDESLKTSYFTDLNEGALKLLFKPEALLKQAKTA